jgi:hypothetical protein
MVRQQAETMPLLLRKLQALGYSHVHLDSRHAPLVASLVEDLLSAGEGCRVLQSQTDGQATQLQATSERVRPPARWSCLATAPSNLSARHQST